MIDKATVDLILDSADIVDVVSDFVTLRRRGTNYVGLCPFHNDRTPSFYVSKNKGLCKCFACGEGGSAVGFIMKHEQLNYHDALLYLANKYHIEVKEREQTDEEKAEQIARDAMFMLNEWACGFFEKQLTDTTEGREVGLAYFNDRGFSAAIIKKFRLGYSPEDRSALYKAAVAQGFNRQLLFDTGLCVDDNRGGGYDRYRGRVIFPIINLAGKVVAFGGRTLRNDKKIAKYVNSPESSIYSKRKEIYGMFQAKREIAKQDKCFIVEGYADVISMHQSGFENVIAASGTALTVEHVNKIHRFTKNVTEMFDGDAAGIGAALKGVDKLLQEGLNMKVLVLPDGDDPDSYSRKHSASEVQQFIDDNEQDFIQFKTGVMLKDSAHDPVKRAQAIEDVTRSIAMIPSEVTRAIYAKECSGMFGIGEDVILRDISKHIRTMREQRKKDAEREKLRQERVGGSSRGTSAPPVAPPVAPPGQQAVPDVPPVPDDIPVVPADLPPAPGVDVGGAPYQPPVQVSLPPVAPDYTRAPMYQQEKALAKYLVKYGMCNFCYAYYEGSELTTNNMTVAEYVSNELEIDQMHFSTPVFARIFGIAVELLPQFQADMVAYDSQVWQEAQAEVDALVRQIDPIGHNMDSLKQEEERIKSQVTAEGVKKLDEFRMRYLEKRLCSHMEDDVREASSDLASEKYTLSKIHTEFATIPTEFDKLETLIPGALNNWKNAMIEQRIAAVQAQLGTAQGDELNTLLTQLQELFTLRSQIAKLIGDRVVNPN